MFAAASGKTSGTVAAGLLPAARQSPTDAMTATMQLVCQTPTARSARIASVRRLCACSPPPVVNPLPRISWFKCGEREQIFFIARHRTCSALSSPGGGPSWGRLWANSGSATLLRNDDAARPHHWLFRAIKSLSLLTARMAMPNGCGLCRRRKARRTDLFTH